MADWGRLITREKQYWLPLLFTSSGQQNASALIYTGPVLLGVCRVNTNGAADALLIVYDGLDNTGKIVERYPVSGTADYGGISFGIGGGKMETGIYCEITGAGALYYIWYAEVQ